MKHIITTIVILCLTYTVHACDCIPYPVETYVGKVDVIFTGKVIALLDKIDSSEYLDTPDNREFYMNKAHQVKVLVLERIKMGEIKADTLEFTSDFTKCDPIYKLGESYLFFADKKADKKFKMTHCSYWGTLDKSQENIRKIKDELEATIPPRQ